MKGLLSWNVVHIVHLKRVDDSGSSKHKTMYCKWAPYGPIWCQVTGVDCESYGNVPQIVSKKLLDEGWVTQDVIYCTG